MTTSVQKIMPFLWFDNQAEEAVNFYTTIFKSAKVGEITRYDASAKASGRPAGSVLTVSFQLEGQEFMALNGGPIFNFTEAISFMVNCESQDEIDYYWEKLSEGGDEKAQQCGWLKDKYGVSWQIVPANIGELLSDPDPVKAQRATEVLLQMKKIDIEALKQARE